MSQVNDNANEAVQTAKAIGVGTQVTSISSSSEGYVTDNLYLNNSTWDLWKCTGTDTWELQGNIEGATGATGQQGLPGENGQDGTDGTNGTNSYIWVRYSESADGTGFDATPTPAKKYMGVYAGTSSTAPTNKTAYAWVKYIGEDGQGAGTWSALNEKPFSSVGTSGLKVASNTLDVDLTKVQSILADATTTVSGKMSTTDKTKLNGIATGANNYSLPTATASVKGGIKVGSGLAITSEVLSANVKGLINNKTDFDAQTVSTSQAVDSLLVKEILDDMSGIALTGTLAIGATSITFTDAMIVTGNTIKCDYYTDVYGISPTEVTISTGSMTLTFSAQTVDVGVRVEIREVE